MSTRGSFICGATDFLLVRSCLGDRRWWLEIALGVLKNLDQLELVGLLGNRISVK